MAEEAHVEDWDVATGVGITALAVAVGRAIETIRPNGLVRDRFAEAFIKAAGAIVPLPHIIDGPTERVTHVEQLWDTLAIGLGLRSKFFDDYYIDSWRADVGQAVLVGAGLDSRAFRLAWPKGCTLFEIDQPSVIEFKERVLGGLKAQPRCVRHVVGSDLCRNWTEELEYAGFDATRSTTWLVEGVFPYLSKNDERQLLDSIHRLSAPGSRIGATYFPRSQFDKSESGRELNEFGFDLSLLLNREAREDMDRYLAAKGWDVEVSRSSDLADRYQRELYPHAPRRLDVIGRCVVATLPRSTH